MRYTGPKARIARRFGQNLFGNPKFTKILRRRSGLPGANRPMMVKKSDYGKQLDEKQKLKFIFGVTEKQLRAIFAEAGSHEGVTTDIALSYLERRLDNVLYRAGFAATRSQARQMASHRHFAVNGKRVSIPSIRVKVGDAITLAEPLKKSPLHAGHSHGGNPPSWILVDEKNKKIEVKAMPSRDDAEQIVDVQQVLEFYSR